MTFFLTAADEQGELRMFNFELYILEDGFDVLSKLVARGQTLVEVLLVDNDQITPLPAEAFDGVPLAGAIGRLEREWQVVLSGLLPQSTANRESIDLLQRSFDRCEGDIVRLEWLITLVEGLLGQTQNRRFVGRSQIVHYQAALNHYERQINKVYALRSRLSLRLEAYLLKDY